MTAQTMWLTLELNAITNILSDIRQQLRENVLYSTKIRASAEPIHNHHVLVGLRGYPTSVNINK